MALEHFKDTEIVDFDYFVENKVAVPAGPGANETKPAETRKRAISAKKKDEVASNGAEVVNTSTLDSYADNMSELKKTVMQLDSLANDLKQDLDAVRASRTLKGKYQYTSMLGNNLASLLNTKAQVIREMNNTIKSSIELDYKIKKDMEAARNGDDDKRIMDMYNAFISAPVSTNSRALLGPNEQQLSLPGNGVQMVSRPVVGSGPGGGSGDPGYDNYIRNLTPEQNLMMYENNPDVQQVVVYNEDTGERFFDVRNIKTGESIPNVAKLDSMFLEDTVIDKKRKIARNVNLGESYPLIVIGGNSSTTQGF